MPYVYSPLRKKLFVTIGEYNKAFKMVEQEPSDRDPRPMLSIVARFMEVNSRVSGLVRNAHDAIAGFPWRIAPSDPESKDAIRIATETQERFTAAGIHHHFDVLMDGEFAGLTGLRQVFDKTTKGKMTAAVEVIPSTQLVRHKASNGLQQVGLIKDASEFAVDEIPPEERSQFIFSYFNPFKSTRPEFLGGLCRPAIPLTIIKNFTWQDWSQFTESYGQPFRTAAYEEGTKDEDKAAAKKALEEFGRNSWGIFSKSIEFKLQEAARNGSVEAYQKLLESIDAELAILFNGEANTSELPERGGSRAAVQTLKLISDDRMWWRLKRIEEIINEQHIAVDFRLNVSESDTTLRPRFEFVTEESQDREANARIIDILSATYDLDDEEVSRKTGFKVTRKTKAGATDGE